MTAEREKPESLANRIAYNEQGVWWNGLSDSHRRSLLRDPSRMLEHAFKAGIAAALRAKGTSDER